MSFVEDDDDMYLAMLKPSSPKAEQKVVEPILEEKVEAAKAV